MLVFGTRPEAIKMAPLVIEFKRRVDQFETLVCVTGQHRSMLDQVLTLFGIKPDFDLNIMQQGQDLYDISSRVLLGMRSIFDQVKPDVVLVHGDTTTSMATALAAYYAQIQVGHVEAGLRTHNIYSPWPEEINRQITGRIAVFNFAPTALSKENLIKENVSENSIVVTGNTVIDALLAVVSRLKNDQELVQGVDSQLAEAGFDLSLDSNRRVILITGHRRENFGEGFLNICRAIASLTDRFPDCDFVYPMHLNPNVRGPIEQIFGESPRKNLYLIEPLDYLPFVRLMERSSIVLTDSGGIQEEAPGLGKPVLVMRDTTERPEALEAGTVKLVGTDSDKILEQVSKLLTNPEYYNAMSTANNPYGDGHACQRIADYLYEN